MNLKESLKNRYQGGNLNTSMIRIGELIIVALLVALGGILYNSISVVPEMKVLLTNLEKRQTELIFDVKELQKCLVTHLQESIPGGVKK